MTNSGTATFVLVHGAWHGGWCWERVANRLRAKGHRVFAPTLTGLAERAHLLTENTNLSTHIADIVQEIERNDLSDVCLVGHSYGTMVIGGAADRIAARVSALVYVDGFIPVDGKSVAELLPMPLDVEQAYFPVVPAAAFAVNAADRAWVDSKLTKHPTASFREKLHLTGALDMIEKKTFVRALGNPMPVFEATANRLRADRGWRVYEIDCGHDIMIDEPDELAGVLESSI